MPVPLLLIVLNGIETGNWKRFDEYLLLLLIVLNGIETVLPLCCKNKIKKLLIVLNGIETSADSGIYYLSWSFNRTKWN